jgi:hypothetical protein
MIAALLSLSLCMGAVGASPASPGTTTAAPTHRSAGGWHVERRISFFGPDLYGHRTACGQTLTPRLLGVASRTLRCGTRVTFRYRGVTLTVPVVDYGPAVWTGNDFDLTGHACVHLARTDGDCFTLTNVQWRLP